jgi:hypothetical protein
MTKQELQTFEGRLQKMGYRKYPATMNNADYAWFKSFGKSKHAENRSNYQIAFSIYDFSPYSDRDESLRKNPYGCSPSIRLSRCINERVDLEISSVNIDKTDIESIEKLAHSFYEWADKNIKL